MKTLNPIKTKKLRRAPLKVRRVPVMKEKLRSQTKAKKETVMQRKRTWRT